jgi:hypothetical protein
MNPHKELVQDSRQKGVRGESRPAGEEVRNMTISSVSGVGTSLSRGVRPLPTGENSAASYSLIKFAVTFDSPKTKDGGRGFECFVATRSFKSTSTSSIFSPSDPISLSSRFSDPSATGFSYES